MSKLTTALALALLVAAGVIWWLSGRTPSPSPNVAPASESAPVPVPMPSATPVRNEANEACQDLYRSTCGRLGIVEDPTGVVQPDIKGEVEALRLYEKIIHEHPQWTLDQVDNELVRIIYTDKRRRRFIETFEWVRTTMKAWIDKQPAAVFNRSTRLTLTKHLDETILQLPPPASLYEGELELFTENDVYYETLADGRRVIRVGGAYFLTVKSRFNRVFTLAHELAHAIDPCEMKRFALSPSAYRRLATCLTNVGFVKPTKERCGPDDQLSEVFADWVAVQITVEALRELKPKMKSTQDVAHSVINSVRDLCNQETWLEYETLAHPDPHVRIGGVVGKHPDIIELLGCQPGTVVPRYCEFEGG